MTTSHKSKQYWLVALKVLVLVLAVGYIVYKIKGEQLVVTTHFKQHFSLRHTPHLLFFLGLAVLNWSFEIYKWKTSVNIWFSIDLKTATKQALGSLTASLVTPNRIGEYGAKAMYFEPKDRKKVVFLNFVHSSSQMLVTIVFGLPALVYFILEHGVSIAVTKIIVLVSSILLFTFLGYTYRKKQLFISGFSIANVFAKLKEISVKRKLGILSLSVIRYLVFSLLFWFLLQFFGGEAPLFKGFATIFAMYLLVSVIPSFFVLDVVIRGGVAVWLFSYLGVSEVAVLSTVFCMWVLNTVLPAIIGSYFVLTFKPNYS
ncbi:lysylphosphatidylglycerol synthase domain-containing protein [Marinirhabdus gelatinilytica]|uniref:Lysylphosphatidylglycerol synthase-like protein n=1 Tax=Marinirhabdus gelatinilytica TaxID=1703343 RepID=A0A370QKK8_9FLAO|nr:lysylphosphatidylglycerol synthase domain-containing protein [Marinirhabdus gelatinilytica]RDK88886.1 lysylphosphatidylglycerol synthase-like protein [Marinirhabdus gelatinilytica]